MPIATPHAGPAWPESPPTSRLLRLRRRWLAALSVAVLVGSAATTAPRAQEPAKDQEPAAPKATPATPTAAAQPAAPSAGIPLARYVPRENLIFYAEFAGLAAHEEAWKKTAAHKMLTTTPLGQMLEEVAGQLLERMLGELPSRKVSGAELVSLCKAAARNGWAYGFGAGQKGSNPFVGVIVLRDAATKENKPVTSRLIGTLMGVDARPKIERKSGRVTVVVPRGTAPEDAWVWWPEKNDVVIAFMQASNAEAILAAIDGKAPSAADHAAIKQLSNPDQGFRPVLTALLDPAAAPAEPKNQMSGFLGELRNTVGLNRIEYQWGFDEDALQGVARLVAPAPRKPILAIFDQPKLDTKHLIPIPDEVDSFVMLSASPAKLVEALSDFSAAGAGKAQLEEFFEKVKAQSRVDVEKDLLGNLGPRMALYLAPGRSAAATDETVAVPAAGADPMAMLSSLQGVIPKPTIVAEVRDPVAFGKALDGVMVTANKELKALAIEKAAQEPPPAANRPGFGPGGFGPGRGNEGREGGGLDRPARKKSARETPAPEFRLMPGPVKTYMLVVPSDSPLKIGAPGIRPTIRLEGKHVAISSTSEAARSALEATRRKDWKPAPDIERALEHVPPDPVFLAVGDPRETVPPILASLPGTLQTAINSVIANTNPGASPARPGAPVGGSLAPAMQPGMRPGGGRNDDVGGGFPGGRPGMTGGPPPGYPGSSGGPPPGYPGSSGMAGRPNVPGGSSGAGQTAMVQLKVDPAKLPKAEELKALMYPGTFAVAVDDQSIRFINRESFPNVVNAAAVGGVAGALFLPAIQAARARAREVIAANAAKAAAAGQPGQPGQPGQGGPPGFPPGGRPGMTAPPAGGAPPGGPPGGRRGRRIDDE